VMSHDDAIRLGAVGPTARASSVDRDIRRDDPYAAYADVTFKVITSDQNDVYGRTLVRVGELMEAYSIIRQLVKNMPDGPITVKVPRKIPAGQALSRYEAPRGEDIHFVRSNGTDKPDRVKVRAPTLANVQAVSHMLQDRYLADLPIVVAAIDPCFSCTDRRVAIHQNRVPRLSERSLLARPCGSDLAAGGIVTFSALHDYSLAWYRDRGLDMTELNDRFRVP